MIKTIFWDFDGVLMNSNDLRDIGFLEVLKDFPKEQVNQLMEFHQKNGGLSRYVKFRYFFEKVRGEQITEGEVLQWAEKFSKIMLQSLMDKSLLIDETINFVMQNYQKFNMHIVSGSDGNELRQICRGVKIDHYFQSIEGSPTPKIELVANRLRKEKYNPKECALIGDSINDYEAAKENHIKFFGFNNQDLRNLTNSYIQEKCLNLIEILND
jgi:phosphoglycolate phosphatase-like HAD superfamily hydrolase